MEMQITLTRNFLENLLSIQRILFITSDGEREERKESEEEGGMRDEGGGREEGGRR